ncbi:MAG: TMEM165/GDT1 family protein [Candidatus Bathyarchaeota archaeon]|nr:TMEM165/GDT1 family protein [Candidatus Bathyarchaeota archaeon]
MDLVPLLSTFLLIFVAELGDKSQLAIISLSSKYRATHVFVGSLLGFLVVDGVSTVVGGPLLGLLPMMWVQVISGLVFIIFGIIPLLKKDKEETEQKKPGGFPLFVCFSLIALMELGDKTQIITITLAAEHPPVLVLLGLTLAFVVLTGLAVLVGAKLVSWLPMKWLKLGTSALFIILGCLSIVGALLGISLW